MNKEPKWKHMFKLIKKDIKIEKKEVLRETEQCVTINEETCAGPTKIEYKHTIYHDYYLTYKEAKKEAQNLIAIKLRDINEQLAELLKITQRL